MSDHQSEHDRAKQAADASKPDAPKPDPSAAPFTTADVATDGFEPRQTSATPGLSQSPGLMCVPNSRVPGLAGGGMVSHVFGPQQNAADPIAAGLDTRHDPMTRAENRVVTQTGELGAGPRPATYAGHGYVQQAGPSDGALVASPREPGVGHPTGGDPAELRPAFEALPGSELAPAASTQASPKPIDRPLDKPLDKALDKPLDAPAPRPTSAAPIPPK